MAEEAAERDDWQGIELTPQTGESVSPRAMVDLGGVGLVHQRIRRGECTLRSLSDLGGAHHAAVSLLLLQVVLAVPSWP